MRASEVDPFSGKKNKELLPTAADLETQRAVAAAVKDSETLAVGRAVMADYEDKIIKLEQYRESLLQEAQKLRKSIQDQTTQLVLERKTHQHEMRSATGVTIAAIAVATICATWRFWPEKAATPAMPAMSETTSKSSQWWNRPQNNQRNFQVKPADAIPSVPVSAPRLESKVIADAADVKPIVSTTTVDNAASQATLGQDTRPWISYLLWR